MPQFLSTSPSGEILAVTPSDTINLSPAATFAPYSRGISIAALGTLSVLTSTGRTATWISGELLVGTVYGISAVRVNATGTTATGIKAWF